MSEPADKTAASSVGERLKAARDRQGLTLQKIGEDLHLDLWVLEAMEENRFRALGAPVYARGHLRKYAQLLGLDVDAALAEYEATHAGPVAPTLVPSAVEHQEMVPDLRPRKPHAAAYLGAAVAVLGAAGAGFWWWRTHPAVEVDVEAQVTAAPAPTPASSNTENPALAAASERAEVADARLARPGAGEEAAPRKPTDGSIARLRLRFAADSWVEIYDATGTRLLFDHRSADTARTVTGVPPFKVLLGNYAGVDLALDGRSVVVPERARNGATARFRILPGGKTLAAWGS